MNLKIAHVSDLSGMYFNIPDYQRGYRWETKQVQELLNDLLEFSTSDSNGQFYCLQPLVVVANNSIMNPDDSNVPVFDVIDGQQRLTTLFLIINFLKLNTSFHLRYERAVAPSANQCQYDNGELTYNDLPQLNDEQIENNPDYFYMRQAIEDIKKWFHEKEASKPRVGRLIEDVIIATQYQKPDKIFYEMVSDKNKMCRDVRFIWYDATDRMKSYKSSIEIFKSMNYGKTSLTSAELIKALLLQSDIYTTRKPEMKQVAFRMSTEWDSMEKKLQDKFMWSMLKPMGYDKPSHIDIVLSYVAKQLVDKEGVTLKALKNDPYYDYLVFNKYFEQEREKRKGEDEEETNVDIVKKLWSDIQDVFAILNSWYQDLELYHLIGLYLMLNKNQNILTTMDELKSKYEQNDREDFVSWLKHKKIGSLISLKGKKVKDSDEPLTLENLYYGEHNDLIINILLTYNVTLCIRHKQDQQRFPFYFCKSEKYVNSLEHIHPQHLHNEDIDFMTLCLWFMDKKEAITHILWFMDKEEAIAINANAEKIDKLRQAIDNLKPVLELTDQEMKQEEDAKKTTYKEKKDKYEANKMTYVDDLRVIDKYFDELADISEKELHSIRNMALVDKDTNAALGNGLLNKKRSKLQALSKEFEKTNGKKGAVTFAGTSKVFNKEYATESTDSSLLASAANLNYWTKLDRENYIKEITEIYNEYVE